MLAPRCVSCGRTVLELRGQFAAFDSYLIEDGEPPPDTAGTWHLPCLERAGVGPRWHAALVRSLVDVRRHTRLGEADGWTAVREPTGAPIAISPIGEVLSLRFRTHGRRVEGGQVAVVRTPEYNLELADGAPIETMQSALREHGSISLAAVYEALGIADCLVRPDLQTEAAFVLDDPAVAEEWTKRFVCAAVTCSVFVPDALAAFIETTPGRN